MSNARRHQQQAVDRTTYKDFNGIYWTANWIKLVERFAYYGVRVVLPVFMVLAVEEGGPEFDHIQKGTIYAVWALVQSFVPIFSGGFMVSPMQLQAQHRAIHGAQNHRLPPVFLHRPFNVGLRSTGSELVEAEPKRGLDWTYEFFFAGAMFLAAGTAIFKPGVQGLIANQLPETGLLAGMGRVLSVREHRRIHRSSAGGLPAGARLGIRLPRLLGRHRVQLYPALLLQGARAPWRWPGRDPVDLMKQAVYGLLDRACSTSPHLLCQLLADVLPALRHPPELHRRLGRLSPDRGLPSEHARRRRGSNRQRRKPRARSG